MAFNGSGTYSAPVSSFNPAVAATDISPTDWNSLLTDLSTALSTAICKDGQTTITANLPMAGFKLTGLGNPSTAGDTLIYGTTAANAVLVNSGKPSFLAHLASTVNNATGNSNLASVTFDTELFDIGSNFASNTFTAPVTGKYRFSLSVVLTALDATMTTQQVQLVIAGTSAKTYAKQLNSAPIASGSISLDLSIIVAMTIGDTAVVKISASGGVGNTAGILGGAAPVYTWFSGELVA